MTLREATEDDLPAILDLYTAAGIGNGESFTVEEARTHFARICGNPSFRIFVAEVDGRVAGTYELLIMENLAKRGRKSGIVEDVAVHPDAQGKGIGRAMMEHARQQCQQAGCYKFTLSSNLRREPAHRFYEAIGISKHGYSFQVEL